MDKEKQISECTQLHYNGEKEICDNHVKSIYIFRQVLAVILGFLHYVAGAMMAMFGINLIVQLRRDNAYEISPDDATWITSIFLLPMGPVCVLTGVAMRRIPRRQLIIPSFIVDIIAWLVHYFYSDTSLTALLISRFIIGAVLAVISTIIPLYLAEVTHPKYRGFCIAFVYMGMSVGILFGNLIGSSFSWRTYVIVDIFISVIALALILYLQETYVWHLKKSDVYTIKESFYWYRGRTEEAKIEISKYIADHRQQTSQIQNASFFNNFRGNIKQLAFPLAMTITLIATMNFSGYKLIMLYSLNILGDALPSVNAYVITISMDVFRIFANIAGCILVKKYSVRTLLTISGAGSALSLAAFCILKHFSYLSKDIMPILSVISLFIFMILAAIGLASLPWVVCGEIFPLEVKSIGCGISLFVYYVLYFIIIKYAPFLEIYMGVIGEFMFFCCCTIVGTLIIYLFMPETKNRTLGDIENSIKER